MEVSMRVPLAMVSFTTRRLGAVLAGGDTDGLVGGVGEQAFFARVDGVEQAFAAEAAVFDDREGAAVEREAGGVGDPEGSQGDGLGGRPEGDSLDGKLGLEDGDEGGFVLADGDGVGEGVFEEVVEGGGGGLGGDGGLGRLGRSWGSGRRLRPLHSRLRHRVQHPSPPVQVRRRKTYRALLPGVEPALRLCSLSTLSLIAPIGGGGGAGTTADTRALSLSSSPESCVCGSS